LRLLKKAKSKAASDQLRFYEQLFSDFKRYIELRFIGNNKVNRKFLTYDELVNTELPKDTNVYIGMFERNKKWDGSTKNCTTTNCIYLDFDGINLTEIKYRIDMADIPSPTMVVSSGNGYHLYWKLKSSIGHELKPLLDELSSSLKADDSATNIAQIMRVPGTFNLKDEPKKCRIIEYINKEVSIEQFEQALKIKVEPKDNTPRYRYIDDLKRIKLNGLHNMAFGVNKGERNFCTGRIVQTLQKLNYSKEETTKIVMKWNELNRPVKNYRELRNDIEVFWHSYENEKNYRYAGKTFSNDRLEALNKRFIDEKTVFFKDEYVNGLYYDNDLLGDDFHKINGLTFAILGIIMLAKETNKGMVSKRKIANLSRRHHRDKTLERSLKYLENKGHIARHYKKGHPVYYEAINKPFSTQRGFTLVPKLLHRLYLEHVNNRQINKLSQQNLREEHQAYEVLNELRYKLLVLLESYAYNSKRTVFVSDRTLANRMRVHSRTIKRNLNCLENEHYIRVFYKRGKKHIELIYS